MICHISLIQEKNKCRFFVHKWRSLTFFRSKVEPIEKEDDIDDILDAIGNVQDPDNVDDNENHRIDDQANVDKDDGIVNSLGKQINCWKVSKDKGE